MEKLKLMWNSKSNVFRLLTVLLLLAGCITPLQAVEPIKQLTLRFEGKKQSDNSTVSLKQVTLSNLSRGCDTTFTSTTFQLQVFPEATGVETVDFVSSMQARLSSGNPFMAAAEVEVMLPSSAPLRLQLYGLDGKIQQRYDGEFEAGTHRFSVEPSSSGVSFLSISDGQSQLTLKLIKLGETNSANISYTWSSESGQYDTRFWGEEAVMLRAATAKPFIYCEGDQLQLIGYADGFANSSLYDVPADNGDYTFLFDLPFYRIFGYQIARSMPSFVDVLFSVEDMNYKGVDNLASSDFIIKENGNSIGGTNESFAYIRKMNTIPYKIQTVLVLDNSYSLLPPDLAKMKAAAISLINNKEDNQEIAVYCFSGGVTLLQDFTTDPDLLVEAVNSIQEGANSTNLYGAFITGARKISEIFTTEQITQGFMVVFTDGNDTQNPPSMIDDAIAAREQKRVYMVGLGDLDATTLNRLANPGPYVPVTNTDELEQVFLSIQEDIVRYANSFYWLNFLSPKRDAGMVTLQVEIEQNLNTGANYYLEGNFNSNGFVDCRGGVFIDPYNKGNFLEGYDESYIFTNDETDSHILSAVTYYAENTPSYVWTSSDESVVQVKAIPQSFNKAELTFPTENNPGGVVTITVRDEANMDRSGNLYERTVQAQAFTVPKLTTGNVVDKSATSVTFMPTVSEDGGLSVVQQGICWSSTNATPTTSDNKVAYHGDYCTIYVLSPYTTYYARAYAVNDMGTGYGEVKTFTTEMTLPAVTTKKVTEITGTSVTVEYSVTEAGAPAYIEKGICYATTENPTIGDHKQISPGDGKGDFSVNVTGLAIGTYYFVRAYATNEKGTVYGDQISFQTRSLPTVSTGSLTFIAATSASCGFTLIGDGGASSVHGGICWSATNPTPTIDDSKASGAIYATGGNAALKGLLPNTVYYIRSYATNNAGTGYGEVRTFKTERKATVTTLAGSGEGYADGMGKNAKFSSPRDVAVDASGNVYVADGGNNRIRKISPEGEVSTLAGSTSGGVDGTGENAKFSGPNGIDIDASGNIYVADKFNFRVRKISPEGEVTTLAGERRGYVDGTGKEAMLDYTCDVALDASGNVFVTELYNNCVRKISPQGEVSAFSERVFNTINGLDVDASGNVFLTDVYSDGNNNNSSLIRKISPQGEITTLSGARRGHVDGDVTKAQFRDPMDVIVDSNGNLYVADTYNNLIRRISPEGVVTTLAGAGGYDQYGDGTGEEAYFYRPHGIAIDASGNIYVADTYNHCIRKISFE